MTSQASQTSVPALSCPEPVPAARPTTPATTLIHPAQRGSLRLARPAAPTGRAHKPLTMIAMKSENLLIMLTPATTSAEYPIR